MKNKLFFLLFIFFFTNCLNANEYEFDVSKININEKGNIINAYNGKLFSHKNNLEISTKKFIYDKNKNF